MRKVITIVILLSIISIYTITQFITFRTNQTLIDEGRELIRQGKIDEGLTICEQMSYQKGICYNVALGIMLTNNQTPPKEFCNNIPLNDTGPIWVPEKQKYQDKMQEVRERCFSFYP